MKDPAFLFYPGDYLRDTQTLSEKSQVAYDRIMCEHMRNICISKQQLKFFTKKLNPEEIEELMFVLTKNDTGYYIEWVADSIEKRKAYSESRRKNRTSKKEVKPKNISSTYDKHMENENENENKDKDLNEIIKIYNDVCINLPKVKSLTKNRKVVLKARMKEYSLVDIGTVIQNTSDSKFLNGENERGWTADFDWIIKSTNFIKILEGNYKNKPNETNQSGRQRILDKYSDKS